MSDLNKNILITPNVGQTSEPTIEFTGFDNNTITLRVLDNGTLSFEGTSGQLFSVTDSLTGTIFSVNDISGIPSIEVVDDGTIYLAEFSGNVLIGSNIDSGEKLQVTGSTKITENLEVGTDVLVVDRIQGAVGINVALPAQALDILGNIAVSGTVDGVDISAFKSAYDTHGHTAGEISGLATVATSGSYNDLSNIPTTFTPSAHTHTESEITDLGNYALVGHSHSISDVTGLQTSLDGKVDENTAITAGTATKITYDAKGLVTAGTSLAATDIPNLDAAKITTGTFNIARIPTITAVKGGTGLTSYTAGNYVNAATTTTLQQRTPAQVLSDIGAAASSHTHVEADITDLGDYVLQSEVPGSLIAQYTSAATTDINQAAYTAIPWDTVVKGAAGVTVANGTQIVVPETGFYRVYTSVAFDGTPGSQFISPGIRFRVNGVIRDAQSLSSNVETDRGITNSESSTSLSEVLNLNANDTVEVVSHVMSGTGTTTLRPNESVFIIELVGGISYTIGTLDGYTSADFALVGHTHSTSAITSGTFADARIAQSNVTQHQAALSITESQISDLGSYLATTDIDTLAELNAILTNATLVDASHTHTEADITDLGNYSSVGHTHTESDITDLGNYAVVGHSHAASDVTSGTFADARISATSVQQHITKTYVDALNVDADTVDGQHASAFDPIPMAIALG